MFHPIGGPLPARRHRLLATGAVLDLLWPTACPGCKRPLDGVDLAGVCLPCWAALDPAPAGGQPSAPLASVHAAVAYENSARAIVLQAKLGRQPALHRAMAAMLARVLDVASAELLRMPLVPVPSHPADTLRRGCTPAGELAVALAAYCGNRSIRRLLRRRWRSARGWKRLPGAVRRERAASAVEVRRSCTTDGAPLLLVDDVTTTGATLGACATALRRAGSGPVHAVVWARTGRIGPPP